MSVTWKQVLADYRMRNRRYEDSAQRNTVLVEVERRRKELWEHGYRNNPLVNRAVCIALDAGLDEGEAMTLVAGALLEQNVQLMEAATALFDRCAVPRIFFLEKNFTKEGE